MAQFNLNDYETVEERLKRLYSAHPDARVITTNLTTPEDRQVSTWVVKAEIYLPIWDLGAALEDTKIDYKKGYERDCWFLKATGHAFEVDGVNGMANKTSALENCETSAIGRALANAGYSGNKRVTREEMAKVARGVTPKAPAPVKDLVALAAQVNAAKTKQDLREVWAYAGSDLDSVMPGDDITFKQAIIAMGEHLPEEAN
jgi:hypothetical protein